MLRDPGTTALDVYRDLSTIAARIEAASGGRQIDVVLLEPQGPIFWHQVLSEGRLVYDGDPERRIDFESDAHVRYFDYLPTYRMAARNAVRSMRHWLEERR